MKTCGKCFRCQEKRADAETKGLPLHRPTSILLYSHKPRPGIEVGGTGLGCVVPMVRDARACKEYHPRWLWNLRQWWVFGVCFPAQECWNRRVRVPLGRLRKPASLKMKDYYDVMTDTIIKGSLPVCPHCGEMPYGVDECAFCGQRFTKGRKEANQDEFV